MAEQPPLAVSVSSADDVLVCAAVGEIEPATAGHFEGEVRTALFSSSASTLVLDLSEVTFIDSSGLRTLIDLHRVMQDRGGSLVLRRPSPTVARLLDITRLGSNLTIET